MSIERRTFLIGTTAFAAVSSAQGEKLEAMYGLIGKMRAQRGKRDALIAILMEGIAGMPGCLSYVIANDPADPDIIWITEVWASKAAHQASLRLPSVRDAISRGRPLIAAMENIAETTPVGGTGLAR
ncbi:putative quinol monooxygenase [Sphingomonas sp. IC4-52]|uniref:putative quinol monooxygenase n=1 Tax=Sphingomonas sp. IC4-52 TaxID=2887202 RepID=UPI001D1241AF|nr:putative quinol monooxygenase [Sphingomonas sp. IC4-52]MCC2978987.1 antibiotic biosynthesis monooxygenase [Sphingomonas sp. IC4-52]